MNDNQNDAFPTGRGGGRGLGPGQGRGQGRGRRWLGEYSLIDVRLVEPALLAFLQEENVHGYALLEKLEALGLGAISPSVIYRILRDFEDVGFVRSSWEEEKTQGPPRRVYSLTREGKEALARAKASLQETLDRLNTIIQQIID